MLSIDCSDASNRVTKFNESKGELKFSSLNSGYKIIKVASFIMKLEEDNPFPESYILFLSSS